MGRPKPYDGKTKIGMMIGYQPSQPFFKPPATGSERRSCSVCGKSVWLMPSSLKLVAEQQCPIVCMKCGREIIAQDEDPSVLRPTDEALKSDLKLSQAQLELILSEAGEYEMGVVDYLMGKEQEPWREKKPKPH